MSLIKSLTYRLSKSVLELIAGAVALLLALCFMFNFGNSFLNSQNNKAKRAGELAEEQKVLLRELIKLNSQGDEFKELAAAQQRSLAASLQKSLVELHGFYSEREGLWLEGSGSQSGKMLLQEIIRDWNLAAKQSENSTSRKVYSGLGSLNIKYGQLVLHYQNYTAELGLLSSCFSYVVLLLQSGLGAFIIWALYAFLYKPLQTISAAATGLSRGMLPEACRLSLSGPLGTVADSIDEVIRSQTEISAFAQEIGNNNYEGRYNFDKQHYLGGILLEMRRQLSSASVAEQRRRWANEGYGMFTDLLREKHDNLQDWGSSLLANLIKYLNMNQGGLFLLQNEEEEPFLELIAAYAWERKKFLNKQVPVHEGLIGQAVLEAETIYLTDVPADFVSIKSGLGKANPTSVLIVPLKYNDQVMGVLELASLQQVEGYQREFIEKLAESLASSLSNIQNTSNTHKLLEESQQMTEQLKRKEEELRNNSIEVEAAREDLSRKLAEARQEMELRIQEIEGEKKKNTAILEGCVDGVITFNQEGKVEFFNQAAEEIWGIGRNQMIGRPIQQLIPIEFMKEGGEFKAYYVSEGQMKPIDVRTELSVQNHFGEELSILLTLSNTCVGEEAHFALFIQRISVELF